MKRLDIIGHLGGTPEWRYFPNGDKFLSFSVGVNAGTKENARTDWVEVSANGKQAETLMQAVEAGTFGKGSQIWCSGRNKINPWVSKTGEPKANEVLYLHNFEYIGKKNTVSNETESATEGASDSAATMDNEASSTSQYENNQANEQHSENVHDNVPFN